MMVCGVVGLVTGEGANNLRLPVASGTPITLFTSHHFFFRVPSMRVLCHAVTFIFDPSLSCFSFIVTSVFSLVNIGYINSIDSISDFVLSLLVYSRLSHSTHLLPLSPPFLLVSL